MSAKSTSLNSIQNDLHQTEARWFAVYTRFKCEKHVTAALTKKNITAYVPIQKEVKQYKSKKKTYYKPLINCYVFVKITAEEYVKVLQTEYLQSFLKQGPHLISIPEKEIDILRRVEGSTIQIEMNTLSVNIGQRVEIIAGNLTGIEGVVVDKKGKKEFIVELQNIAYEMRMNIDSSFLQAIA